ncbi:MAG: hypothetical protein DCC67_10685 [Planctomycetota bacterium]|nr:MAG: hypothetical protein DCC67_10685 [Planctomycetota bacterium]
MRSYVALGRLLVVGCLAGPAVAQDLPLVLPAVPAEADSAAAAPAASDAPVDPVEKPAAAPTPPPTDGDDRAPDDALQLQSPEIKSELEQRLKALDNAGLTAEDKQKAAELYQQAIEAFDVANQQIETARSFQKQLDELPAGIREYTEKLNRPLKPNEDVSGLPLAEVEKRAAKVEASVAWCREQLALMKAEPKRRSQRMAELPQQIADAQAKLKDIADQLSTLGAEDVGNVLAVARRAALVQGEAAQRATLQALECEQRLYQEGAELIRLRRDYYARYVPHIEKRLAQRRAEINRRREAEARQQAQDAAQAASDKNRTGETIELAVENKLLAERRTEIVAGITTLSKQLDDARKRLEKLRADFSRAQEQAQVDELAEVIGSMLRQQQASLPNLRELKRSKMMRESERSRIQLEKYDLYDKQAELVNLDDLTSQLAARSGDLSEGNRREIRQLLDARSEILGFLIQDYEKYSQNLYDLDSTETQLIATTEEYAQFIAKRVLWIRSCMPLSKADVPAALQAAAWGLDPRNWSDAGVAVLQAAAGQPGQFALFAVGFAALVSVQRLARRRLHEEGVEAAKRGCARLQPTLQAAWLTAVVAAPWPAMLGFLGWAMDNPLDQSEFVRSLSAALRFTAVCLLLLEVLRHLCRRGGLGRRAPAVELVAGPRVVHPGDAAVGRRHGAAVAGQGEPVPAACAA